MGKYSRFISFDSLQNFLGKIFWRIRRPEIKGGGPNFRKKRTVPFSF